MKNPIKAFKDWRRFKRRENELFRLLSFIEDFRHELLFTAAVFQGGNFEGDVVGFAESHQTKVMLLENMEARARKQYSDVVEAWERKKMGN